MAVKRDAGIKEGKLEKIDVERLRRYINLKLASLDLPVNKNLDIQDLELAHDLIENFKDKNRVLSSYLCPVDRRIQDFLNRYLKDSGVKDIARLPANTFVLDKYGLARELSIAPDKNKFENEYVKSYRIKQGILHNPRYDRRTTKGTFHIVEGGLPVPPDKIEVPKKTFALMLKEAFNPPSDVKILPFTSSLDKKAEVFVSLHLRPLVCPEVEGFTSAKYLETRFFAPGSLVSNLDFVESIFGNGGDPYLPEYDAALDPDSWTGHTGCVILAPHLNTFTKKDLGLPDKKSATKRQLADNMYWEKEDELYNNGSPFKITCRDQRGVIVTIIGDNYFGYSKKEVKTQIGYSANLYGLAEEEHAGGAIAFSSYNNGLKFVADSNLRSSGHCMAEVQKSLGDNIIMQPEGHGIDANFNDIVYVPEDAVLDIDTQSATWSLNGKKQVLRILKDHTYIHPTGYKVRLDKHPQTPAWRFVGTSAEGILCHKPCTVSGGGKSEISKSLWDAIEFGSVYISDFNKDMDRVAAILDHDFGDRFRDKNRLDPNHKSRPVLSPNRSLGSVIKLLTPSEQYSDEYNSWLKSIPTRIKALVYIVKRFYRSEWGDDWRSKFSVDIINSESAHELRFLNRKIEGAYLRIGKRVGAEAIKCKLRQDFMPSEKIQMEDDISASINIPSSYIKHLASGINNKTLKIVENCEFRLFQRPDDAVIRGYDKQAEKDLSSNGNFISNFEALDKENAVEIVEKVISFCKYTSGMRNLIEDSANDNSGIYFVSSSHPRIVDGKPTKNPRYLQTRPDLINIREKYIAEIGTRIFRKIPAGQKLYFPVNSVLSGRRLNPAEPGIRPLAVYAPIHYQELPELFMDFICSLTGKSPSTTGAGTEGALTKAPFNALIPTSDLNNALLSFILCGYDGFSSAAGYIGSGYKVSHDVSLLVPELWCRLFDYERDSSYLIDKGFLEKINDFEFEGKKVQASRLGYRINREFVNNLLGRLFDNPETVFNEAMLRPETQNMEEYVDGINNIVEAQQKVAVKYIEDGSVEYAIPPLKAILHIMAEGSYKGKTAADPEIRELFKRETVMESSWYKDRLLRFQRNMINLYEKNIKYLKDFKSRPNISDISRGLGIERKIESAEEELKEIKKDSYIDKIKGTIGADILYKS